MNILISWIGAADLCAISESDRIGLGPIAQAVQTQKYQEIVLISDYSAEKFVPYREWLQGKTSVKIAIYKEPLTSPTDFGEIYRAAVKIVSKKIEGHGSEANLTFHLSPGTPAMAAVWIILSKTRFPAELIESSREHGVKTISIPFDISADFIPDLLRKPDQEIERLSAGLPLEAPEFEDITHRSKEMRRIILMARRVAPRSIPVVIEGESGTGKELLARAIHLASPRREKEFVAINCGAIPSELVESELFGHEKGSFTGATVSRKGKFEVADGGTLFLDELCELPKQAQVKLLRILQEGEVVRVGAVRPIQVNVRIIAATNRDLFHEINTGAFREDLFYRLAVAMIKLPPLSEREGDLSLLIDKLLEQVNNESKTEPGYVHKNISPNAINIMLNHPWPGNVRELLNTLRRAAVWSSDSIITEEDIREALLPVPNISGSDENILNRPIGAGINFPEIMGIVAGHYLKRGLAEAHGNKTKAANLLGLTSYQTLTNWLIKYRIE